MTTQPKHNYIKILMEYVVWVDGLSFAIDMYDRKEPDEYTKGKYRKMQENLGVYLESLDGFNSRKLLQHAMEYHENRDRVIQRSNYYYERNLERIELKKLQEHNDDHIIQSDLEDSLQKQGEQK